MSKIDRVVIFHETLHLTKTDPQQIVIFNKNLHLYQTDTTRTSNLKHNKIL